MNLPRWKLIKTGVISIAILVFAVFAIEAGGDPTVVGSFAIGVVGLIGGVELAELAALGGFTLTRGD